MSEENAIQLRGVVQNLQKFRLGPLHLDIPSGYITAIVGPNGSGKSSLFRLLLDQNQADEGQIEVMGEQVGKNYDRTEQKQRIGYLADEPASYENRMKGSEKSEFNRFWYRNWNVNRYRELLQILAVDDNQHLGSMSKGMRRKFELALSMAHEPDLLLLDEPSSGLDPLAWKTMIDILHRYMETGTRTILMTTHIIEEVKRLADYIVFMAYGQILGVYEKDELLGSWFTVFIRSDELTAKLAEAAPGQCGVEHIGGSTYRITTNRVNDTEAWCMKQGIQLVSRQPLELDEIMGALLAQERLSNRQSLRGEKLG